MKSWKKVMIVALCVIATGVVISVCLVADSYYQRYIMYDDDEVYTRRVSEHIYMEYCYSLRDEYARLKDSRTGKYTTPKLQHIFLNEYDDEDSLVVFRTKKHKRGYLNVNTGKIVIPAGYDRAWNFSEGLAAVVKDGVISFINSEGNRAFENTFPVFYNDDSNEIPPLFHNDMCVMHNKDNRWGMINKQGEWVTEPVYHSIFTPTVGGYRIMSDGCKYGLLAKDGSLALTMKYDEIKNNDNNDRLILIKDGLAKEVDSNLNTTAPFIYDDLHLLEYVSFNYDDETTYSDDYVCFDIGMYTGVMDTELNVIFPAIYYRVRLLKNNIFEVQREYDSGKMLIDTKGNPINISTNSTD